jgi:hypothetical protein
MGMGSLQEGGRSRCTTGWQSRSRIGPLVLD